MELVKRIRYAQKLSELTEKRRVTTILGPRQCGKTTLARQLLNPSHENYFDLENPVDETRLESDPMLLSRLKGTVVIDEVQRNLKLFNVIRHLADREERPARFVLLGSASPELRNASSQTLAGRTGFLDMTGFACDEIGWQNWDRLWLRGGFPESFRSMNDRDSFDWRTDFIRTFLERDIPQFGLKISSARLRNFWTIVASHQGQSWNSKKIAQSIGVSHTTARDYLDVLEKTFMLRSLSPFFANVKKRVVKAPKVYFRDSGILHSLLNLHSISELEHSLDAGLSWEGFAIEQIIRILDARDDDVFYWATQSGAEVDLLIKHPEAGLLAFEIKRKSAPTTTKSMHIVMDDLKPKHMFVIYPGDKAYQMSDNIWAIPLQLIGELAQSIESGGVYEWLK